MLLKVACQASTGTRYTNGFNNSSYILKLASILNPIPDWFPDQAFLCIALLVGDGLYNFLKVIVITVKNIRERSRRKNQNKGI
jgi:hypothetical protein